MSDPRDVRSGRHWPALAGGIVVALVALGVLYRLGTAGSPPDGRPTTGMVGYVDPQTGQFAMPPADVTADLDARAARAPGRLVERPSPTPGGGMLLDGAPMMQMTATVGADGHVSAGCGRQP